MITIDKKELAKFQAILDQHPPKDAILVKDKVPYCSISYLEQTLDTLYLGLWEKRNITTQLLTNEIVVSMEVRVFHPVFQDWIARTGIGAVPIQQSKGSKISEMVETKIMNAIHKNAPAAHAFAFKNAVQSLGNIFGRNLSPNRLDYELPALEVREAVVNSRIESVQNKLAQIESVNGLTAFYKDNKVVPGIASLIQERRNELMAAKAIAQ